MADLDIKADYTPQQAYKRGNGTTVANLRTALTTYNATSYSPARLQTMSKRDMLYAVRLHGLSVSGL